MGKLGQDWAPIQEMSSTKAGNESTHALGTEGGKFPFWSSDGRSIGFFADRQLKRLDLAGGPPTTLTPAADARGGTWAVSYSLSDRRNLGGKLQPFGSAEPSTIRYSPRGRATKT
jgi:hypothetical protein